MSDETTLLPCPFCGGEAEVIEADYGMYMTGYAVYCRKCCLKLGVTGRLGETYEWSPVFNTEAEAIAAWNIRADYHGYEQAAIEAWENIKAWNTRAELGSGTCSIVKTWSDSDYVDDWRYRCSECGGNIPVNERDPETGDVINAANYCPNCGRKVVNGC